MAEDDADSVYSPEDGEQPPFVPRRAPSNKPIVFVDASDALDRALDESDLAEAYDNASNDSESDYDSDGTELEKPVSTRYRRARRRQSQLSMDGDDSYTSGTEGDPIAERMLVAELSRNLSRDGDGFASDENIVDDGEDDIDSSDDEVPDETKIKIITDIVSPDNERQVTTPRQSRWSSKPDESLNSSSASLQDTGQKPRVKSIYNTTTTSGDGPAPHKSFFGNIARAGATFYKQAFKNRAGAPGANPNANASAENDDSSPRSKSAQGAIARAEEAERTHRGLISLIEAQIATLNGAKAGFVDLALLKPMTEKTCRVIEDQVITLLEDYGKLNMRIGTLQKQLADVDRQAEEELSEKEQVLIAAKMSLAEAQGDVMNLKHELNGIKKELADPRRQAAKTRAELSERIESAREDARTAADARRAAEETLSEQRRKLHSESQATKKLEAGYKDMEGDWA